MDNILGPIVLVSVLLVPISEVFRRILVDKKYCELFPNEKHIKRDRILFNIDLSSVPSNEQGREFLTYFRKTSRLNLIPVLVALSLALIVGITRN